MAQYKPIDMVKEYHGQICMHSDTYFQKRGKTLCVCKVCNPRNLKKKPYSAKEIAVREKFRQVRAAVKALSDEQRAEYARQFENLQRYETCKYSYLSGYIFAKEYEKLNPQTSEGNG